MSIQVLHPPNWLPPVGYANGISVAAGRIVFIAGQVGWDADQHFQSEDLVPQFEQALKNILAILAEAGGKPSHICRLTAFCIDKPAYIAGRREFKPCLRRKGLRSSAVPARRRRLGDNWPTQSWCAWAGPASARAGRSLVTSSRRLIARQRTPCRQAGTAGNSCLSVPSEAKRLSCRMSRA